jgi:hypothetical protein
MFEKINPRETFTKVISLRDILLLIGIFSLGYGLYMVNPWISFTICGVLIMSGGLFMKEK